MVDFLDPEAARRQRADAGDRGRHTGRRAGLPEPAVPHDRHRRRGARDHHRGRAAARPVDSDRLRARRRAVRRSRLHRDERLGPRQRAHRTGGDPGPQSCAQHRVPRRCHHRPAGGRPRSARRRRLLLAAQSDPCRCRHARTAAPDDRLRLRRVADIDLRATRRRHLHQGCGCRCRPGRQGRGRHSGRRPAQSGGDRRQRRRQRRRLRRHGGGPVRDLRGHGGRDDADRRFRLQGCGRRRHHLSAGDFRRVDPVVDRRLLLRQGTRRRQDHERAVPRPDRRRRDLARAVLAGHQLDPRTGRRQRRRHRDESLSGGGGRSGADGSAGLHHRVLHRYAVQARSSTSPRRRPRVMRPTSSRASRCR